MAQSTLDKPETVSSLRILILAPCQAQSISSAPTSRKDQDVSNFTRDQIQSTSVSSHLFPPFLKALTSTSSPQHLQSFAGYTTHQPLQLKTRYYNCSVLIWCDDLPPLSDSLTSTIPDDRTDSDENGEESWVDSMLSDVAAEVRAAIGGVIVLLPYNNQPSSKNISSKNISNWLNCVAGVNQVREAAEDESGREVATVVVIGGLSSDSQANRTGSENVEQSGIGVKKVVEDFEEALLQAGVFGWNVVGLELPAEGSEVSETDEQSLKHTQTSSVDDGRNEYGELTGMKRVIEVLEQVDWSAKHNKDSDSTDQLSEDISDRGKADDMDMEQEMADLYTSLEASADVDSDNPSDMTAQVDAMARLLDHAAAAKEAAAALKGEEKNQFARREVERMMREMRI